VIIFGSIGVLVLLLACINYINLSTAFSADRFKDVGVRKVMGAARNQLVGQYLSESWLLVIGSLVIAFLWIELSRPLFESLTEKPVAGLYEPITLLSLGLIATLVGLASGLYPAALLSSFRPAQILKGTLRSQATGSWLRKGLVVFQYSITIILVIGILVVQMQFRFIESKDLGYDQHQLLTLGVNGSQEVRNGYVPFAQELVNSSLATGVTRSNSMITGGLGNSVAEMDDATGKKLNATVYRIRVDYDYLDVHKMKLLAGRFLSADFPSDSSRGFVVNESLTKAFGYSNPADAVGKAFDFGGNKGEVIGVIKDFHYNSLQHKVDPTCMFLLRGNFSRITLRLDGPPHESMARVSELWKKHFPNSVLDFDFSEDALASQYRSEQRFSQVFMIFSGISLAIASLGLFALVSFTVQGRTKEIGIRKVLGASIPQILGMLSKEFILLVLIASVLAVPLGYYAMQRWLNGFAYRMDINPLLSIAAVAFVLVIAWVTVSIRSIVAARANPVDALRSE
jgi:putative ABC transport system permease protein